MKKILSNIIVICFLLVSFIQTSYGGSLYEQTKLQHYENLENKPVKICGMGIYKDEGCSENNSFLKSNKDIYYFWYGFSFLDYLMMNLKIAGGMLIYITFLYLFYFFGDDIKKNPLTKNLVGFLFLFILSLCFSFFLFHRVLAGNSIQFSYPFIVNILCLSGLSILFSGMKWWYVDFDKHLHFQKILPSKYVILIAFVLSNIRMSIENIMDISDNFNDGGGNREIYIFLFFWIFGYGGIFISHLFSYKKFFSKLSRAQRLLFIYFFITFFMSIYPFHFFDFIEF